MAQFRTRITGRQPRSSCKWLVVRVVQYLEVATAQQVMDEVDSLVVVEEIDVKLVQVREDVGQLRVSTHSHNRRNCVMQAMLVAMRQS